MFQQLKDKISDKLWSLGSDEQDKTINDLVTRGTAETLIAPEWSINMALVDMVNQNPTVIPDKLVRVLKRTMLKPNAKTQVLSLTILETCIKNCDPALYAALSTSELWLELVKMTADTSISRVDAEVRDKILCMVDDYAKVLPQKEFREAYEYLLETGVDFPVRSPDEQPPILTPPPVYQPPVMVAPGGHAPLAAGAGGAAAAAAAGGHAAGQAVEDPFAGMSEEDRAAIQAAMREMEEEERVVRESVAVAASTALFQQMDQQQQGAHQQPQDRHAGGAAPQQRAAPDAGPALPEDPQEALQAISTATGLLNEMLAAETDPREPFVVELAEQCVRFRSKLEDVINTLADEAQLASALVHHEALQAAISKYDEHLSKVQQGAAAAAGAAAAPHHQQQPGGDPLVSSFMVATAAAAAAAGPGAPGFAPHASTGTAGPNFTLLGDDDEEDSELLLSSKRNAGAGAADAASAAPALDASLIDLLDAAPALPSPGPALASPGHPPIQPLDSFLDQLHVTTSAEAPAAEAPAAGAPPQGPAAVL